MTLASLRGFDLGFADPARHAAGHYIGGRWLPGGGIHGGEPVFGPGRIDRLDDRFVGRIEHGEATSLGGDDHGRTVARR